MTHIASSDQAVLANIDRFRSELDGSPELQERLAYARAWYAHRDAKGIWRFGPSKFVGYEGLDAKRYIATAENLNGRRTEAQLRQWFQIVEPNTPLHAELSAALFAFLAKYGKTPSTIMRINVLKPVLDEQPDADQADTNDTLVDLLVAVAKSLPPAHLRTLQTRLST
jgi:hypothetical protein